MVIGTEGCPTAGRGCDARPCGPSPPNARFRVDGPQGRPGRGSGRPHNRFGGSSVRSAGLFSGFDEWLQTAAEPNAVAELFVRPEALPRQLLARIARSVRPDDTPNDYGEDPWLTAVRGADGAISGPDDTQLLAFLLARSLGDRSRNPAELAQLGFESTYIAAAQGNLTQETWRLLDSHLPWSMRWFEWDRCKRLRAGVVDLFVESDLSPQIFGDLVQDGSLFADLAEQVARSSKGRSYLKNVRRSLTESPRPSASARQTLIGKLIK